MKLVPQSIIVLLLDAFDGRTEGKTLLQKRVYFLEQLLNHKFHIDSDLGYNAHYYGPYSATISDETAALIVSGLVQEATLQFGVTNASGFEMRRYSFELTEAGKQAVDWVKREYPEEAEKVSEVAQLMKKAGNENYVDLSIAAKAHWILKQAGRPLNSRNVTEEANKFSWTVSEEQIERGFEFLSKLKLGTPFVGKSHRLASDKVSSIRV